MRYQIHAPCQGFIGVPDVTVIPGIPNVCAIGDTVYASLDDALMDVPDNTPTTIKLLADVESADWLTINDKNLTIETNEWIRER